MVPTWLIQAEILWTTLPLKLKLYQCLEMFLLNLGPFKNKHLIGSHRQVGRTSTLFGTFVPYKRTAPTIRSCCRHYNYSTLCPADKKMNFIFGHPNVASLQRMIWDLLQALTRVCESRGSTSVTQARIDPSSSVVSLKEEYIIRESLMPT